MTIPPPTQADPSGQPMRLTGIVLFAAYAAWLIYSLPGYGPTWDVRYEFPRATAYLSHALGEETPSNLSPYHRLPYDYARSTHEGSANACLPSLVAAATGKVFFEWLGVSSYIDAYHLGLVLLWLAFVFHFHSRLRQLHGPRLALLASILLVLAPRIAGHVPNNMKDIPALAFATAALLEIALAITRDKPRRIYVAAFLFACGVSSKFVAGFVVFPATALLILAWRNGMITRSWRSYLLPLASFPVMTVAVLFAHWPFLWVPFAEISGRLSDVFSVVQTRRASSPSLYPFTMALITTPLLTLAGVAIAAVSAVRGVRPGRSETVLLTFYAIWLLLVLGIFSSGKILLFDGVRHFLLFMPPTAILAAWGLIVGADNLQRLAPRQRSSQLVPVLALALVLVVSLVPILRYHPYEVTYFNGFTGGLPGALDLKYTETIWGFEPRDYWGTSLRPSVDWANDHLPYGAKVSIVVPSDLNFMYEMRPDLVHTQPPTGPPQETHYVIFLNRRRFVRGLERRSQRRGELLYQVTTQGIPLSFVYRIDPQRKRRQRSSQALVSPDSKPSSNITSKTAP